MSKITVGCRLPNGLVLRLQDGKGGEKRVTLRGQNADMNGALYIQPTHCGYTEVDKDFWEEWIAKHYAFVSQFWTPSRTAYKSLALTYVMDPSFKENYDAHAEGLAKFVQQAINVWANANLSD